MLIKRQNSPYWYAYFRQYGKLRGVSLRTTSRREAQALHDEIKERYKKQRREEAVAKMLGKKSKKEKPLAIKDVFKKFAKIYPNYSEAGRKTFFRFARWLDSPDMDIAQIDTNIAFKFLNQFDGKTFNTYKSALSKIWHVLSPFCDAENIWKKIPNRPSNSINFRPLAQHEIDRLLSMASPFWRDAIIISLYTGLRKKDVILLQWKQIKDGYIELIPSKTLRHGKAVYIPIHKKVSEVLQSRKNDTQYVFPIETKKLESGAFQEQISKLFERCGVFDNQQGRAGFHSLRTTFITRCEERGVPRHVIQGIVGHSSPAMTEHYSHDKESAKLILQLQ